MSNVSVFSYKISSVAIWTHGFERDTLLAGSKHEKSPDNLFMTHQWYYFWNWFTVEYSSYFAVYRPQLPYPDLCKNVSFVSYVPVTFPVFLLLWRPNRISNLFSKFMWPKTYSKCSFLDTIDTFLAQMVPIRLRLYHISRKHGC